MKLIMHPTMGFAVYDEEAKKVLEYNAAMEMYPTEVQALLAKGEVDLEWKEEDTFSEYMNPPEVEEEPAVEEVVEPEPAVEVPKAEEHEVVEEHVEPEPEPNTVEVQEEPTVEVPKAEEPASLNDEIEHLLPEECKGEVLAFTYENVTAADVRSDFDCIEGGWEQRGDYFMVGVKPTDKIVIHSDKKNLSLEVPWHR